MLNGKERQAKLPEFLVEAENLQTRMQECCQHLALIRNDRDAIDCLLAALHKLSGRADVLGVHCMADFARHIHDVLSHAPDRLNLHDDALQALQGCLTLLAWQLELIDPHTGQLGLDDSEQAELIATLAERIEVSTALLAEAKGLTLITFPGHSA
ncbi:Hpt domain-containing protein [Pseudomonas asplenii]|uniref:Hpt domain-containing protein n=1 Tax=Pseudomonas asplenii TaxID=53407 RepID=UPI00036F904A|nr:Hpt domain-containing protein [Pseudomonas fuscovaginae]